MINYAYFTSNDIKQIFGNSAQVPDYLATIGVSTDTRTLKPGNIFVALRGERFDGHDNIYEAIIKGAVCIVFEESWLEQWNTTHGETFPSFPRAVVPNTLHALGDLATYHRKRFRIPVIAIAGAAGKTSTKELTRHLLSQSYNTLSTPANYNNQVGTPLTLLQLHKKHQIAVIEIGTNEPGEIELLTDMTAPTHGVITNIGKEHLEKLIDLEGVEKEETALFRYLKNNDGVSLVNIDDDRLRTYVSQLDKTVTFSTATVADVQINASFNEKLEPIIDVIWKNEKFSAKLQTVGYASVLNAACSIAVALSVGMETETILQGLTLYTQPEPHGYARMVVEIVEGKTLLNDCYNANPESMKVALQTLSAFPSNGRRFALLGDMREMGASAEAEHIAIIKYALDKADELILFGDMMKKAIDSIVTEKMITICSSHQEAVNVINSTVTANDVILIKGSRGLAMENIIAQL